MPIIESGARAAQYGLRTDPAYDWRNWAKDGYSQYASDFASQPNDQAAAALRSFIDRSAENRAKLNEASFGQHFIAGLVDPINYLTLPFGGPVVGVGRSALRVGASVGAIEAGREIGLVQPFDPVATAGESAVNVLSASLFGGAIGGLIAAPAARRAATYQKTQDTLREYFDVMSRSENLKGMTPEAFAARQSREERPFGALPDEEVSQTVARLRGEAETLRTQAEEGPLGQDLRDRADAIDAQARGYSDELGFRFLETEKIDLADPYRILPNRFTDSVLFKMVSTPMKRALQSDYPSAVKEQFVKLAGDSGITLLMNSIGVATPPSVFQRTAADFGRIVKAHDELTKLWASDTGASPRSLIELNASDLARRATRDPNTYGRWLEAVSEKRMKGITDLTENEIRATSIINDFFDNAAVRLEEAGLIGTPKGMANRLRQLEDELADLRGRANLPPTIAGSVGRRIGKLEEEIKFRNMELAASKEIASTEPFFPRFFDHSAIQKNRKEFSDILFNWYQQNPRIWEFNYKTGQWEQTELSTNPADIRQRAESTIDGILGERDVNSIETVSFGVGRSKHFRHRQLDIPNSLVTKFMMRDPLAVMKTYSTRIEPRYHFAKEFGKDYDGVLLDLELAMAGRSPDEINAARKDFDALFRRVAGNVIDNPEALSQKAAFWLREAASFAYMGGAGIAALPDFGRIVMEYDFENVVKGVQALTDKTMVNMTVDQVRYAGEAVDILRQSAHMRIQEDLSANFQASPLLNSARNAFYILNGLAPMTTLAKQLAGIVDAHTIIDYSIKLSKGELDDQSRTWLARYGIDEQFAQQIARAPWQKTENGLYMGNTDAWPDHMFIPEIEGKRVTVIEAREDGKPVGKTRNKRYIPAFYNDTTKTINFDRDYIEGPMFEEKAWLDPKMAGVDALPDIFKTPRQWSNFVMMHEIMHTRFRPEDVGLKKGQTAAYENKINQLALEEYRKQTTLNDASVTRFKTALNSGVLNTIMAGTPADKPIITDGVVYLPIRIAKQFGFKEDARIKGYARVENGFMGLPFQFYSFILASLNKTVGALAHGQVKNRVLGSATMLGLAYMSLKLRTPTYVWEDMSYQDKAARAIDMSGLLSIYSDLFYTGMHTSLALGGPNITGGFLSPKFRTEYDPAGAITGLAGAGPSWATDMLSGVYDFATGNFGEGASQIVRNLPGSNLWFLKNEVNELARGWRN
jgi:hypothetical protein